MKNILRWIFFLPLAYGVSIVISGAIEIFWSFFAAKFVGKLFGGLLFSISVFVFSVLFVPIFNRYIKWLLLGILISHTLMMIYFFPSIGIDFIGSFIIGIVLVSSIKTEKYIELYKR